MKLYAIHNLKSLILQNFCGIKHLEITPGGSASIYGDNATGKTTIANAFLWLFTGKNSAGTSELDPQPLDGQNGKIHNLETSVTAVFEGGSEYRRTLSEVWTKKRGEAAEKLTGTKTAYYKDGVPMKEKEFTADIEREFGGADRFRMLTIPGCFPTMDWKQRHNILFGMYGDVTDSDVIDSDAALAELPEFLGSHSVEDYLKIVKSRKTELKREIDLVPARISENRSAAGDSTETDTAAAEKEIRQLESEEKALLERLAALDSESPSAIRKRELQSRLEEARIRFISEQNAAMEAYSGEIRRLTETKSALFSERSPLLVRQTMLPQEIERMKSRRAELVKKTSEIRAKQYDGGENCPCCGQKLPPEQLEKAIAEFNRRKSEELERISEEARQTCHKDMIAAAEKELTGLNTAIAELSRRYDETAALIEGKIASKPMECRFEDTEEHRQITAEIKQIESVPRNEVPEVVQVTDDLTAVRNRLHAARERLAEARAVRNTANALPSLRSSRSSLPRNTRGAKRASSFANCLPAVKSQCWTSA